MKIYPDCIRIYKGTYKTCWECSFRELCQACKNNGCSNEEKEFVLKPQPITGEEMYWKMREENER